MIKHYQAKRFLQIVREKPHLFPIWELEDWEYNGVIFTGLSWRGPGRRILWTPHALERVMERSVLNFEDDVNLCRIQTKLKTLSAQPWLHTLGVGEYSLALRPRKNPYTLAFLVMDANTVIIKTFMSGLKITADQTFKAVNNMGEVMGRPEDAHLLVDKTLWSDKRKADWDHLIQNPPDPMNKYAIRLWMLRACHVSGDASMHNKLRQYIITGDPFNAYESPVSEGYAADVKAGGDFAVQVLDFIARRKGGEDVWDLKEEVFQTFATAPPRIQNIYDDIYKIFRKKTCMTLPSKQEIQRGIRKSCTVDEVETEVVGRKEFTERTKAFQALFKKYKARTLCDALGVSRSKLADLFWDADPISQRAWEDMLTMLSQQIHPCETAQMGL